MNFIEVLKQFSIENLDTEELLIDCQYRYADSDKELYERFLHNFKCILGKDDYEILEKTEVDDKFLEALKEDEMYEIYDIGDNITYDLLCAAALTDEELVYDEIDEGDWDDMYWDTANYEICLGDFNFKYTCETDIDMT